MKKVLLCLTLAGFATNISARTEVDTINVAIQQNDIQTLTDLFNKKPALKNAVINKGNTTPLLEAARSRAESDRIVELLLTNNPEVSVDVNQKDADGNTPLALAALMGKINIMQMLIDRGATIDAKTNDGETPLFFATDKGRTSAVKLLIDNNADVNVMLPRITNATKVKDYISTEQASDFITTSEYTRSGFSSNLPSTMGIMPLHIASEKGYKDIVELLISNNAKLNATIEDDYTPLLLAAENNRAQVVDVLLRTGQIDVNQTTKRGYSALHLAAMRNNKETIQELLDGTNHKKANLEQLTTDKGYTPLFLAVLNNKVEAVKALLNNGANTAITVKGYTPLHHAAEDGFDVLVDLLIPKSNVNAITPKGYTPLHLAAKNNRLESAKLLLKHGASVNAQTVDNGYTPLHEAIMSNNKGMVELLIKAGADANIKTKDGSTAWNLAQELPNKNIAKYLETVPNINKSGSSAEQKRHHDELSTDA